ncbi:MAG: RNA methyltransferase [Deltaproteobacteria bacterium]|nr:RNA methyltransferase [Deltaproteobacteria bacterium]
MAGSPSSKSSARQVIDALEPLLHPRRVERMRNVLAARTAQVVFAFESMVDPHNLSAALRTLDAFSFQDVYFVRYQGKQGISKAVTRGVHRWLSLHEMDSTEEAVRDLKAGGYQVLAGHLGGQDCLPLQQIDFSRKVAFVFGNEHSGVSPQTLALADGAFQIPMLGMVESFNLSVSAAICAFHARQKLEQLGEETGNAEWFLLDQDRKDQIYIRWLMESVRRAPLILAELGIPPVDGPPRN